MKRPPFNPDVADTAPSGALLTAYDEENLITYLRLLDGDSEGADWREVARILDIDANKDQPAPRRRLRAISRALSR